MISRSGWIIAVVLCLLTICVSGRAPAADGVAAAEQERSGGRTMGGIYWWSDVLFFHDWRIQRNAFSGHCRLLDGENRRHSSGSFARCHKKLAAIKRKRNLPPMRGKAVILLHGLGASRLWMDAMADYLAANDDFRTFNVSYSSITSDLAQHAGALASIIKHLDGIDEIYFVAHSMGNIVVRHYLGDHTNQALGFRPDPRIKRMVMLSPPNHGAYVAGRFDADVVAAVVGPAGSQLGEDFTKLRKRLATPQFEFGIIASGRGDGDGYNPLLPGDDDGLLRVETMKLAGARDFVLVKGLHQAIPRQSNVQQYALRFLQHGYFVSDDSRNAVVADLETKDRGEQRPGLQGPKVQRTQGRAAD